MNTPSPQRYVAYYRVSTLKQGQSGLGLEAQEKAVQEFLSHYGGEVIAEFKEVESGKNDNRPELTRAADYCELSTATLLVAKLDRLSRDLHFITSLQKRGIQFKLADMPEIDNLTIHILAAMAEHEAKMISARTKAALSVAKSKGTVLGNPLLDLQRNTDVDPANTVRTETQRKYRQKIQKVIDFLVSEEGITTCTAVATALNTRGLRSFRGLPFTVSIVSKLMRQREDA